MGGAASDAGKGTLLRTAVIIILSLVGGVASAQDRPGRTNQIHYPLNEELGAFLQTADKYRKAGNYAKAAELYRAVLDGDGPKKGYQLAYDPTRATSQPRRLRGITQWAMDSLRQMPKAGVKVFRAKYDYRASSAIEKALQAKDPFRALARVYELYPISGHAVRMLERLADLSLEGGELGRARRVLRRLLTHHKAELKNPPRIRKKLLVCAIGLGRAEEVRAQALALQRDDPQGKIHLNGAPVKLAELIAQALQVEAIRTGRYVGSRPSSPLQRGDPANRAVFSAKPAFGSARFQPFRFAITHRYRRWRFGGRLRPGSLSQMGLPARNMAVVHQGQVFVTTADSLKAYDMLTGRQLRHIRRPPNRPSYPDPNPKVQFGASINRGILVAPFVQEVLLDQSYRGIPIKVRIPIRKLAGFELDPRRWRWRWDHGRKLVGTPMQRWSFPTPPTAVEGVAYASAWSIEGFVNTYVAAFDVRTGAPLWSTWVASGQVEQTMFGEQATEPLCVPIAVSDGIVYHSTSFGCVGAVSADTGRPLWVTEYDQIEVRAPRGYYADPRNISWESNAPVVVGGVVVTAPLDSNAFYGFDARTGKRLWKSRQRRGGFGAEASMRYIMGAAKGSIVLGGGHDVRCLDVRNGKRRWRRPLRGRLVSGRGLIAGDRVCIPVDNNKVLTFDLATGNPTGSHSLSSTGNLLLAGDSLVVTGNGTLAVHRNGKKLGRDFK